MAVTLTRLLVACCMLTVGSRASQPPTFAKVRARNETLYGEIDVTNFPSCAVANCITSNQLSPSRLGCVAPQLTTDCLCHNASTPLACAPSGPSDQDNCWYELEDWFAGACQGSVPLLDSKSMPDCIESCVLSYISTAGCATHTRNCFCIIPRQPLVDAVSSCLSQNCLKKMQSSFSPAPWRDEICKLGQTGDYNQDSYDSYGKMVHDTRIAVPVVLGILTFIALIVSIVIAIDEDEPFAFVITMIICAILLIVIIVPIYLAL